MLVSNNQSMVISMSYQNCLWIGQMLFYLGFKALQDYLTHFEPTKSSMSVKVDPREHSLAVYKKVKRPRI